MESVVITMAAGDQVRAEASAMTGLTDGVDIDARLEGRLCRAEAERNYVHALGTAGDLIGSDR